MSSYTIDISVDTIGHCHLRNVQGIPPREGEFLYFLTVDREPLKIKVLEVYHPVLFFDIYNSATSVPHVRLEAIDLNIFESISHKGNWATREPFPDIPR